MRGSELRENAGIIGRQFLSFAQSPLSLTFLGPHGWQSETRTGVPLPRAPQRRNRAEAECVQLRSRQRGRATRGFFRSFRRTCPVRRKRVAFVTVNLLARSFRLYMVRDTRFEPVFSPDVAGQNRTKIAPKLLRPVNVSTWTVDVSFFCTRAFPVV
jgi:hypothetical protein